MRPYSEMTRFGFQVEVVDPGGMSIRYLLVLLSVVLFKGMLHALDVLTPARLIPGDAHRHYKVEDRCPVCGGYRAWRGGLLTCSQVGAQVPAHLPCGREFPPDWDESDGPVFRCGPADVELSGEEPPHGLPRPDAGGLTCRRRPGKPTPVRTELVEVPPGCDGHADTFPNETDRQMDAALTWSGLGADLSLSAGDLAAGADLQTAVILSLFTDARADADVPLPPGASRRGWWGDAFAAVEGDRTGSLLWTLAREKQTAETARRAAETAERALAWMIADGVAAAVRVTAEWVCAGVLGLAVAITKPDGTAVELPFEHAWGAV